MIEKTSDVADRPASNSSAMGSKNAPNEYATPKTVAIEANAAATLRHPSLPSTSGTLRRRATLRS